ncbi:hypothetical protein AAG906_015301 [Vitis piasezkii]
MANNDSLLGNDHDLSLGHNQPLGLMHNHHLVLNHELVLGHAYDGELALSQKHEHGMARRHAHGHHNHENGFDHNHALSLSENHELALVENHDLDENIELTVIQSGKSILWIPLLSLTRLVPSPNVQLQVVPSLQSRLSMNHIPMVGLHISVINKLQYSGSQVHEEEEKDVREKLIERCQSVKLDACNSRWLPCRRQIPSGESLWANPTPRCQALQTCNVSIFSASNDLTDSFMRMEGEDYQKTETDLESANEDALQHHKAFLKLYITQEGVRSPFSSKLSDRPVPNATLQVTGVVGWKREGEYD